MKRTKFPRVVSFSLRILNVLLSLKWMMTGWEFVNQIWSIVVNVDTSQYISSLVVPPWQTKANRKGYRILNVSYGSSSHISKWYSSIFWNKKILDYKNYFIFFDSLVKAGVYYLILQADCSYLRISKEESEGISSSLEK